MRIHYWKSDHGNFGDDLNEWLWDRLLPGLRDRHDDILLVGVGTVLRADLPSDIKKLVIGAGAGYRALPDVSDEALWDVRAVRGKDTARALGIDEALGITDPAVLIADFSDFQNLGKTFSVSFVPHWESDQHGIWERVCAKAGIHYISPCQDAEHVIKEIAQSELVIAESMHAAIFADAFRVPWVPVKTSKEINAFKWQDWLSGLNMTYTPVSLPVTSLTEARAKGASLWGVPFRKQDVSSGENRAEGNASAQEDRSPEAQSGIIKQLKHILKMMIAWPAYWGLQRAAKARPSLSDPDILERRKSELRSVLEEVKDAYGLGT